MSDRKTSTTTTKKQDAGDQKEAPKAPAKAAKSVFETSLERGYFGEKAVDKESANGK